MNKILLINGPNLNLLGKRQVSLYGSQSLEDMIINLKKRIPSSFNLVHFQSNVEGEIVNFLNAEYINFCENTAKVAGIIINPAAYTHTSIAIRDALEVFRDENVKIYEVHLSNIFAREEFRHKSYISPIANGVVSGFGVMGYELALQKILQEAK
ncbi:MAG: type II 3-dehydroquinate dehydratase [Bdellovibrionota bacterium]